MLDEVVVVGYGTQKKVTLTGAVASIKEAELISTKNENTQNMLTGKISGVRVMQKSAEPGSFNNNFDIRGMGDALIIIDGQNYWFRTKRFDDPIIRMYEQSQLLLIITAITTIATSCHGSSIDVKIAIVESSPSPS